MEFIYYLITGALTGLLSGLFGVGGGIIIVGILTYLFQKLGFAEASLMHLALGTSLASIIFTSASSARAHHSRRNVNWSVFWQLSPYIILGTLSGAFIASLLNTLWLKAIFSVFVILVAIKLMSAPAKSANESGSSYDVARIQNATAGILIGIISSLVGIGGGTLSVPYLNHCKINMRLAIGTSAAIGLPIAIAGTAGFIITGMHSGESATLPAYSIGFVYLPAFIGIALSSVVTAPLGAKLAHKLPISTLKKLFALLLLCVGLRMLWGIV